MFHRAGNSGFPAFEVSTVALLGSVRKSQFQYTAKGTFLAYHAVMSSGGYDFVTPPSRRHLCGKSVLGVWLGTNDVCNVIGERTFGLGIVCEARFQEFPAYGFPIHIQLVNSQSGGHPLGGDDFLYVFYSGHEPGRAIGRETVVVSFRHGGVCCGNPFGFVPGRRF